MQTIGTCPTCKREDAPIEVLQIGNDNRFRGRCSACGTPTEGFLLMRTEPQTQADAGA